MTMALAAKPTNPLEEALFDVGYLDDPVTGMRAQWIWLTPALAQWFLDRPAVGQRPLSKDHWKQMSIAQSAGQYTPSGTPIQIDVDGLTADGLHRCRAVVDSGVTIRVLMVTRVSLDAMKNIDIGKIRRMIDRLKASQLLPPDAPDQIATIAGGMLAGQRININGPSAPNTDKINGVLGAFEDAIWFAYENLHKAPSIAKPIYSCVARAYLHVDKQRLKEWCEVFTTGMPVSQDPQQDSACILFRNFVLTNKGRKREQDRSRYEFAQNSIKRFAQREPTTQLKKLASDVFPLPQDWDKQQAGTSSASSASLR